MRTSSEKWNLNLLSAARGHPVGSSGVRPPSGMPLYESERSTSHIWFTEPSRASRIPSRKAIVALFQETRLPVDELPDPIGAIRGCVDVIHLNLIHRYVRLQPFRRLRQFS